MGDEEKRRRERVALVSGDEAEAKAVERERTRLGEGVYGFLARLVGEAVYIEGARINYRGTLREILRHGDGTIEGLVMQPCQRVSYFDRGGPSQNYTYTHKEERLVPWEMVHDIGREGFAEGAWRRLS